jgi:hypothetical protein
VGLFRLEMAGGACWPLMMGGSGGGGVFRCGSSTWREHKVREEMVLRWEKDIGFEWTC